MLFMLILGQAVSDASCLPNLFPLKQIPIAWKGFLHGRWKWKNKKDNFTLDFTICVLLIIFCDSEIRLLFWCKKCFWTGRCHHAFSRKTLTDLNLFFSLGESDIFMKLQVQCRNADSFGVLIANSLGLTLYECLRFLNRFVQEKNRKGRCHVKFWGRMWQPTWGLRSNFQRSCCPNTPVSQLQDWVLKHYSATDKVRSSVRSQSMQ